jgi:hypothetical protein
MCMQGDHIPVTRWQGAIMLVAKRRQNNMQGTRVTVGTKLHYSYCIDKFIIALLAPLLT